MSERKDDVTISYRRQGGMLHFTARNATNHELREILVGWWARLDQADRIEHIRELMAYQAGWDDPAVFLSPVARAIRDGVEGENAVDVDRMIRAEHSAGDPDGQ